MGDGMYEAEWQVRFSECDKEQKLTYNGIVNYFQDCSNLQSEELGAGAEWLKNNNRAWIMDFWQIIIKERPKSFDLIRVATWPNGFKGFFGTRNFTMKSKNEEILAYANSYWVYIDTITGHPARLSNEEIDKYILEPPLEMDYAGRKIDIPDEMELIDEIIVRPHQIDLYHHMNNGRYIETACDYIPADVPVWQICCQYKKQARLAEHVRVYRKIETSKIIVVLKDMDDNIYAAVSFDIN